MSNKVWMMIKWESMMRVRDNTVTTWTLEMERAGIGVVKCGEEMRPEMIIKWIDSLRRSKREKIERG